MPKGSRTHRLMSADSHLVGPPYLYEQWVERKYQDQVPKPGKDQKGGDGWLYKGAGELRVRSSASPTWAIFCWTATFISGTDRVGIQIRHAVGLRNTCWSTDFPHHGNDWPYSRRVVEDLFVNVPEDEKKMIVCDNAARLYGLMS